MQDSWEVRYADKVLVSDIPALDAAIRQRIRRAIEQKIAVHPLHFGKPLRYSLSNLRSLRVGDYRVLFSIEVSLRQISIVAIGHRRDIYEGD